MKQLLRDWEKCSRTNKNVQMVQEISSEIMKTGFLKKWFTRIHSTNCSEESIFDQIFQPWTPHWCQVLSLVGYDHCSNAFGNRIVKWICVQWWKICKPVIFYCWAEEDPIKLTLFRSNSGVWHDFRENGGSAGFRDILHTERCNAINTMFTLLCSRGIIPTSYLYARRNRTSCPVVNRHSFLRTLVETPWHSRMTCKGSWHNALWILPQGMC